MAVPTSTPAPEVPRPKWTNLEKGEGCETCDAGGPGPNHYGSPFCKSHGLAAPGGTRAHCSCDSCY